MPPFIITKLQELLRDNAAELGMFAQRPNYLALRLYARLKQTLELIQGLTACGVMTLTPEQQEGVKELRSQAWQVVDLDAENPTRVAAQCEALSLELAALFQVSPEANPSR